MEVGQVIGGWVTCSLRLCFIGSTVCSTLHAANERTRQVMIFSLTPHPDTTLLDAQIKQLKTKHGLIDSVFKKVHQVCAGDLFVRVVAIWDWCARRLALRRDQFCRRLGRNCPTCQFDSIGRTSQAPISSKILVFIDVHEKSLIFHEIYFQLSRFACPLTMDMFFFS